MSSVQVIEPVKTFTDYKQRVCAYARVSTDSEEQLNSYTTQVNYYTELITQNEKWAMAGIYTDEGVTGTDMSKREGFNNMLRACRNGKIDKILTKSISRFARNTKEAIETIRELRLLGISIEFEKEHIDTEKMKGDWTIEVLSAMAQAESVSISQNMRWSYKVRMKRGEFITNTAPYGYRLDNGKLIICDAEAKIVKQIFNMYLSGIGTNAIAQELHDREVVNYTGTTNWSAFSISSIIKNEKYIGDAIVQKTFTTEVLPFKNKCNKGEKEKYYIKEAHEGIISKEDFEQANQLLKERGQISLNKVVVVDCFNRKIKCGECGSTLCRKKNASGSISWRCYVHERDKSRCNMKPVNEELIKKAFTKICSKLKSNESILNEYLEGVRRIKSKIMNSNEMIKVDTEIQNIIQQNLSLNRLRSKGYIDSAIFIQQSNENNQKIKKLLNKKQSEIDIEEYDEIIMRLNELIDEITEFKVLHKWQDKLFGNIVESVILRTDRKLQFNLIGGIKIVEEA